MFSTKKRLTFEKVLAFKQKHRIFVTGLIAPIFPRRTSPTAEPDKISAFFSRISVADGEAQTNKLNDSECYATCTCWALSVRGSTPSRSSAWATTAKFA
jgi:hypothetical protein